MFYAHFVLAKKGPLARIWLAAHWDKKLTKAHVFETNIEKSVDGILQPKVKMALRTSGHLLLGVVRIYSRKAKYLLADCNEAFVKIKMAFRPGMVDLPEEHREAAVNAITLPEVFHDFDAIPELNDVDIEAQFNLNQSRAEEITMREDYTNIPLVANDDGFGDMGFDTEPPELMRNVSNLEPSLDQTSLLFSDGPVDQIQALEKEKEPQPSTSGTQPVHTAMEIDEPIRDDGFGGNLGQDIIVGGLFEGGLFDDTPMAPEVPAPVDTQIPGPSEESGKLASEAAEQESDDDDDDIGDHFGGPPSVGGQSSDNDSRAATPVHNDLVPEPPPPEPEVPVKQKEEEELEQPFQETAEETPEAPQDHTTLLHNEEESFALAPVDASALRGFTKTKRKRKLIVDEVKNISGEEMKAQLSDTSDIVTTLDLAPPTKRLMHWKETGGVEKLFALPGRPFPARGLSKNYQRHLTSKMAENVVFGPGDEGEEDLNLEQVKDGEAEVDTIGKRAGRKRKQQDIDDTHPTKRLAEQNLEVPQAEPAVEIPPATPQMPPATPAPPATPLPTEIQDVPSVMPATPGLGMLPSDTSVAPMEIDIPQLPPEQVQSILQHHDDANVHPMSPASVPQHIPLVQPATPLGQAQTSVQQTVPLPSPPTPLMPPQTPLMPPPTPLVPPLTPMMAPQTPLAQPEIPLHESDIPQLPMSVAPQTPLPASPTTFAAVSPSSLAVAPPTPLAVASPTPLAVAPPTPLAVAPPTPLVDAPLTPLAVAPPTPLVVPSPHEVASSSVEGTSVEHVPEPQVEQPVAPDQGQQDNYHQIEAQQVERLSNEMPHNEDVHPTMENMGYDANNPMMANMGYDEHHPHAHTPGAVSERGVATPWNEDYEFPHSVGQADEQQVDETYEQFEERVLNKRASHMYHIVKSKLVRSDKLHFSEMTLRNNRKQVAQKFYTLLVLKKHRILELSQESSYDEIIVSKGDKFDSHSL